ncbi:MAG: hypothetical protein KatS3mg022_1010 [Armatimonadota bacterium]|nr:MAG: hypothetical protein KatS3mg022_1010 [Armatimonadota bacterium]
MIIVLDKSATPEQIDLITSKLLEGGVPRASHLRRGENRHRRGGCA